MLFFAGNQSIARTITAVSNSNWSSSSTWICNGVNSTPTCGDTIVIPAGKTVTVNSQQNYTACGLTMVLNISGTLQFTNGNKLGLPCNSCLYIASAGLVKKATPGAGNSTYIEICGSSQWQAATGPINGPATVCGTPLPVTLLFFDAKYISGNVELTWVTASEINNDYFLVERSIDGKAFSAVTKVKGAGNSTSTNEYHCADYYPASGITYYRLKQIDYDGNFSYSDIVAVYVKNKTPFDFISVETTINSTIRLTFSSNSNDLYTLQVYELDGSPVFNMNMTAKAGMNNKEIYCPFLKKGIYLLTISNDDQVISTKVSLIQ